MKYGPQSDDDFKPKLRPNFADFKWQILMREISKYFKRKIRCNSCRIQFDEDPNALISYLTYYC